MTPGREHSINIRRVMSFIIIIIFMNPSPLKCYERHTVREPQFDLDRNRGGGLPGRMGAGPTCGCSDPIEGLPQPPSSHPRVSVRGVRELSVVLKLEPRGRSTLRWSGGGKGGKERRYREGPVSSPVSLFYLSLPTSFPAVRPHLRSRIKSLRGRLRGPRT